MASSVKTIFKAAHVPIEWEQFDLTGYTTENVKDDSGKLRQAMDSIRKNKVALKGMVLAWSLKCRCRLLGVHSTYCVFSLSVARLADTMTGHSIIHTFSIPLLYRTSLYTHQSSGPYFLERHGQKRTRCIRIYLPHQELAWKMGRQT